MALLSFGYVAVKMLEVIAKSAAKVEEIIGRNIIS